MGTNVAVLGPGGIGGLIGGALARSGNAVTIVPRPESASTYPSELLVESVTLGTFRVPVRVAGRLDQPVEVLWVATKAYQLADAIGSVDPAAVDSSLIVALMNGIDHVASLRAAFPSATVVAGSIRTESTRVEPGHIVHSGWHVVEAPQAEGRRPSPSKPVQLAREPGGSDRVDALAADLERAGIPCQIWADENYLLWTKLAILCPYALATTAAAGPIGAVRDDPELSRLLHACTDEIIAVSAALGTELDRENIFETLARFPDEMRVSMERDAAAGRPIEIVAVTSPVLREGRDHAVATPATRELRQRAVAAAWDSVAEEDRDPDLQVVAGAPDAGEALT